MPVYKDLFQLSVNSNSILSMNFIPFYQAVSLAIGAVHANQLLFLVLREFLWVSEFQITADVKNHIDKVVFVSVPPCAFFSELNFRINAFENTV